MNQSLVKKSYQTKLLAVLLSMLGLISASAQLTTLTSFSGTNGESPVSGLTLSGNTLYGTTQVGGTNGDGEVFSVPATGGSPTVLASFNGANGSHPAYDSLTLSGNTLYGTTFDGGANNDGEVFSVPVTSGSPTVLASFSGTNGQIPMLV